MAELTAAEKAELRRQKILAKKKARMAFVTQGDPIPSQLPVQTPSTSLPNGTSDPSDTVQIEQEPTAPLSSTSTPSSNPCTTSNTRPIATANVLSTNQTTHPPTAAGTGTSTSSDITPLNAGHTHHPFPSSPAPVTRPPSRRRQSMILFVRMLLLISVAVFTSVSWPDISAFKTFLCLRTLLALPSLKLSHVRSQFQSQRRSKWTLLDIVTSLPHAYVTIQTIWQEFALFMTATLLTISLMRTS